MRVSKLTSVIKKHILSFIKLSYSEKAFYIGLSLLFFLPVIESFSDYLGYLILLFSSFLIGFRAFVGVRMKIDLAEVLWLLLLLALIISTLKSWSILKSFDELLIYYSLFIIYLAVKRFVGRERLIKNYIVPFLIINSLLLVLLFLIYRLITPLVRFLPQMEGENLFISPYRHNRIVDILIYTIPLCLFLYLREGKKKFVSKMLFFLFGLVFLISTALGALVSLAFSLFFFFMFVKSKFSKVRYFSYVVSSLGLVTIALILFSFYYSNIYQGGQDKLWFLSGLYKPASQEKRFAYYAYALKAFLNNPIYGTGLGTFRYATVKYAPNPQFLSSYVHNHFLEMYALGGFFSGGVFLFLISLLILRTYKSIAVSWPLESESLRHIKYGLFVGVIASVLLSFIDYSWHFYSVFFIFWFVLSVMEIKTKKYLFELPMTSLLVIFAVFFIIRVTAIGDYKKVPIMARRMKVVGEGVEALRFLTRYQRLDAPNSGYWTIIASIYLDQKDYDKAHQAYQEALALASVEKDEIAAADILVYFKEMRSSIVSNRKKDYYQKVYQMDKVYREYFRKWITEREIESMIKRIPSLEELDMMLNVVAKHILSHS